MQAQNTVLLSQNSLLDSDLLNLALQSDTSLNMAKPLKILFIPVSSAKGIGEYMRSLIIAEAIKTHWPDTEISFALNKHAPYAQSCPFPHFLLNSSPTKEIKPVNQIVCEYKPDVTVFDCSGRASQIRHAKACGSKVIFISQHKKKRKRGFSFGRLPFIDAHWITQFKFVDGDLTWLEKLKLKICNAKTPQFIGPVFSTPDTVLPEEFSQFANQSFVLWAPGGGGHSHNGIPATDVFYHSAMLLHNQNLKHIVVAGANYQGNLSSNKNIMLVKSLPNVHLMTLVRHAKLIVCGGGDLMGQALVLHKNIVAIPVAKDQPKRIAKCLAQEIIYSAALNQTSILTQVILALNHPIQHTLDVLPGLSHVLSYFESVLESKK